MVSLRSTTATRGHDITAFAEIVTIGPNMTNQIVTIPISNDGQPGESNTTIPLTLSSPGAGATLGAATTASLVIHDNNPFPAPAIVESVRWETIKVKVGNGNRARTKSETVLDIQFSGLSRAPVTLRLTSSRASRRRRPRK